MDFSRLTKYLEQLDHNMIPDCRLVVYKDHECLYDRCFAREDVDSSESKKDMYYLFSASKVITCTAALRLMDEGKINIDDNVSKYLPEFAELYIQKDGVKTLAKTPLTIRHLFSMQGGLTYDLGNIEIKKIINATNNQATTREMMRGIAKMPLLFEPGENYNYSLCHDVLAAVVEVASGKKFSEYLREVIFDPLGMKDITMRCTENVAARLKQQYGIDQYTFTALKQQAVCPYILTEQYESGGAGMISTVEDYIKFADAMACGATKDGYRILKPETLELMHTNQLNERSLKTYRAGNRKEGCGYAFGVRTMMEPDADWSYSPIGEFGWDGAAGAYCVIDTENHLSIYLAQHVLGGAYTAPYISSVHHSIRNFVYEAIKG